MRPILVENAGHKQRPRHGGDRRRLDADLDLIAVNVPSVDLFGLNEAAEPPDI